MVVLISADFAAGFYGTLYGSYSQCSVSIESTQYHTLALNSADGARSQIGNEANLLAYQILRLVPLGNA